MLKKFKRHLLNWFVSNYKHRKRAGFQNSVEQALASAYRQIERSKYAFLVSQGDRFPDARLIEPLFEKDGFVFWIGTRPKSRKVEQIKKDSQVTLAFSNQKDNSNLLVKASAELVDDIALRAQHWKPYWRLFFPSGPKGDDYLLIKLNVKEIEVLDFSQNVEPEPFGLKPFHLVRSEFGWKLGG